MLRSAGGIRRPLRLLREGKYQYYGKRKVHDCKCKLATWKCQEPCLHAPGKQPGHHTHGYTAYVPGILVLHLRCVYIYVCLEACDYRAFVARMTNQHVHWLGVLDWCLSDVDGWKKTVLKHTASSSVEHVVEVTAKRRLFMVTSVIHTKNSIA